MPSSSNRLDRQHGVVLVVTPGVHQAGPVAGAGVDVEPEAGVAGVEEGPAGAADVELCAVRAWSGVDCRASTAVMLSQVNDKAPGVELGVERVGDVAGAAEEHVQHHQHRQISHHPEHREYTSNKLEDCEYRIMVLREIKVDLISSMGLIKLIINQIQFGNRRIYEYIQNSFIHT